MAHNVGQNNYFPLTKVSNESKLTQFGLLMIEKWH